MGKNFFSQYCVGFCLTTTWVSHKYTYFFPPEPSPHPTSMTPFQVITEHQGELPGPCSSFPLAVDFVHGSVCAVAAKSLQLCPTLRDPTDSSPLGSSAPGILQARTLECVAISFSNAWKWKVKVKSISRAQLFTTYGLQPTRLLRPWDFPGKSTGMGCHCLLRAVYVFQCYSLNLSHPLLPIFWLGCFVVVVVGLYELFDSFGN